MWQNKQSSAYSIIIMVMSRKVMPYQINPLTRTIFDPVFLAILREIKSFTFPQQDANRPLWVTTSTISLSPEGGAA